MTSVWLGGCAPSPDEALSMEGGVGGCFSLIDEHTCVTKDAARLVVWVEDTSPGLRLRGRSAPAEVVEGGTRWIFHVDEPMRVEVEDAQGTVRFAVDVRPEAQRWRDALYAGASCAPIPDDPDADTEAFYASGRARCADEPEPMTWLERAIDAHRARGDGQRLDWDLAMWAELATYWEPVPEGPWLPSQRSLESRYFWHYHHGRRANAMGNLADAHWFLEEARKMAVVMKREDGGALFIDAATSQAENLANAGRHDDAAELAEASLVYTLEHWASQSNCKLLSAFSSASWFDAFSPQFSSRTIDRLNTVDEMLADTPEICPPQHAVQWHAIVNRANHLARTGHFQEAADLLENVSPNSAPEEDDRAWATLLMAQIALNRGKLHQVEALVSSLWGMTTPDKRDAFTFSPQAHLLAGQASLRKGESGIARARLRKSLSVVENLSARAPLGHSRGSVLDSMALAAWLLADLDASSGQAAAALDHLRRHRRRALLGLHQAVAAAHVGAYRGTKWSELRRAADTGEALDAVEAWERETGTPGLDTGNGDSGQLPPAVSREVERILADEALAPSAPLRAPADGELMVLASAFEGILELWTHRTGGLPNRQRVPDPGSSRGRLEALGRMLSPHLDGISQLTYLPLGPLRSLPMSRVPVRGMPLGLQLPVATSLDLGLSTTLAPLRTAVVIADPTNDLASARAEGQAVAVALDGAFDVDLRMGEAATEAAMFDLLDRDLDFIHFAGHASFADDGWSSGFALAGGAHLPAWKLLTLDRVPPVVSMTACESSRSARGATERLGLAQAFVLAGSHYVVAADQPVDDALARTFGEAWAQSLVNGKPPPEAWLTATQHTAAQHPTEPWWSFRLWTP